MTDQIDMELEASAALAALMEETALAVTPDRIPTTAQRKAALQAALDTVDLERLIDLQDKMARAVDQILANRWDEATELCTDEQLKALMVEHLDQTDITDLLKLRYEARRAHIFAHLTALNVVNGVDDPLHAPAEVAVPELGKKFVRQGGRPKVTLNEAKFTELIGPERAAAIFKTRTVTETYRDDDAIMALVAQDPSVMELLRECIVAGGHTPSSFHVRNLKG
jgi:hypothetical protein